MLFMVCRLTRAKKLNAISIFFWVLLTHNPLYKSHSLLVFCFFFVMTPAVFKLINVAVVDIHPKNKSVVHRKLNKPWTLKGALLTSVCFLNS